MPDGLIQTTFLRKEQIAHNTWAFFFEKLFDFTSGQYVSIFFGNDTRDFTIASPPLEKEIMIVTKEGISTFKKSLFSLKDGAPIKIKQPSGGFIFHNNGKEQVFLAGGIGITVFYTIIQEIVKKKIASPVTLFVSFSKKEDMIFYEQLQKVQQENKNIHIVYTLSQSNLRHSGERSDSRIKDDKFETGRISGALVKKYIKDFKKAAYMIAGGEQMVEDTEEMLLQMKIPQENIRIDIFTGY